MENILRIEREIADLQAKQAAAEEQHKTIFQRLAHQDELLKSVQELALSVRDLANAQACIQNTVTDLSNDMDSIKSKPARNWTKFVEAVVIALAGAMVTLVLNKLGVV